MRVRFVKEVPQRRGGGRARTYEGFVDAIKARPNEWAVMRRNQRSPTIPDYISGPDFEVRRTSCIIDGVRVYTIYVRYVQKRKR